MHYIYTIIITLLVISCQSKNDNEILIEAKNKNIHYIGRIDSTEKFVEYSYSGVGIVFHLEGKKCLLEFSTEAINDLNYLSIEINHEMDSVLKLERGKNWYDISALLKNDTNFIQIYKRTEASIGSVIFHGIKIDTTDKLLPLELSKRKILWIGNSITCGYGNEISVEAPPKGNPSTGFHSKNENNYLAWGSISSRKLNAQCHQVCYSGIGIYRNFNGDSINTMPKLFDKTMPDEKHSSIWNHQNYIPELIIIELGTNDFAAETQTPPLILDSLSFVNSYIQFINQLKNYYPNAKIICVVGNMLSDNYPKKLNKLSRCRQYVKAVSNHFEANKAVYFFELAIQKPPFGENWHPSLKTHQEMSEQIVPFIQQITEWK